MANTVNILGFANTFGDWIVATNADSNEINSIGKYDWTKDSGTLFLNGTGTSVSVGNNAIISGQLQVTGTDSSATIDNNLTVGRQVYLTNTTQSLTASGIIYANGTVYAGNTGTGLSVSNNTLMGGTLTVSGPTVISNTINVLLATTLQNTLSVGKDTLITANLNVTGLIRASNIQANTSVNTATLSVTGTSFTDKVQANTSVATNAITANTLLSNTSITTSNIQANTSVATNAVLANTILANTSITTDVIQSNTSVNTSTLSVTGTSFTDKVQANTSVATNAITANTLLANTSITTGVIQSNTSVNTTTISVTGTSFTDKVQANTSVATNAVLANTILANTSITTNAIQANTSITTGNIQANTSVNTTTISVTGTSFTNTVQANTSVATNTLQANTLLANTSITTGVIQSNTSVNTTTISVTGTSFTDTVQANTSVATNAVLANTLLANTSITTGVIQSNTSVNTTTISVTGTSFTNTVQANTSVATNVIRANTLLANNSVLTGTIQANTSITTGNIQANTSVNTTTISVTGNTFTSNLIANTSISTGTLLITGSTLTATNAVGSFQSLTTSAGVTVGGNFTIIGQTIYASNNFVLNANNFSPITSFYRVNRGTANGQSNGIPNANGTIRWNETNKYWDILDVNSVLTTGVEFSQIMTANMIVNSTTSTSTTTVPTNSNLTAAFLKANTASANAAAAFAQANNAGLFAQPAFNQANAAFLQANTAFAQANNAGLFAQPAFNQANAAYSQANAAFTQANVGASLVTSGGSIGGNLSVVGNLQVNGSASYINVATFQTVDSLIQLAANNTADSVDIGFYGQYVSSGTKYAGLVRTAASNFALFQGITSNPTSNSIGAITAPNYATLNANIAAGQITSSVAIPITSGGTGVTTSTGSGSNVLSTSPTLVTPILGTPQSGLLTNATGLPLTTGVTGTLPVGNGGTGVTTSTGSGSNVLSTSPTLVTPALGTPSSGNLSNCTFPTLNQNTSGTAAGLSATLALGSGGTGNTTGFKLFDAAFTTNINANTDRTVGMYGSYSASATNTPTGSGILYNFLSGATGQSDGGQFWQDYVTNNLYLRQRWGGVYGSWLTILSSNNYNSYSPTLTGTGASGTWGISISGTAAGLSVTLAVASGGTGVTTSTGSGNNVLSTSPTLVSPVLGTPTSGNLANCTFPTLNQSTTGNAGSVTNATFYRQFTVRDDRTDGSNYSLAARPTGLYAINSTGTNGPGAGYLSLLHIANGSDVAFQLAGGYTSDNMYFRGTSDLAGGTGYTTWRTVVHSGNYTSYSPSLTGTGASGTWGISVTGSAGSAASAATATTATTATNATNVYVNLDASTNTTRYVPYASSVATNSAINGSSRLTFNPSTGDFTAAGNITAYSDERVKINWRGFGVDFIGRLAQVKSGVYDRTDSEATQVGVSAQSLQSLMPNAVIEDDEGMLSVSYGNAALVSSIELAKEVVDLKNRLAELERIIAKLQ